MQNFRFKKGTPCPSVISVLEMALLSTRAGGITRGGPVALLGSECKFKEGFTANEGVDNNCFRMTVS